jgi:serine protease AprX
MSADDISYVSRPASLDELHGRGVDGEGVTVAVIDSGVAPHPDFGTRIKAFKDFDSRKRKPHDPKGHGTHVAGIILGDGEKVDGIAPKADLVACRIASEQEAIQAVDWVIANKDKYSIDVLNLSLGVDAKSDPEQDEFRKAAERAVDAGLVVVVSAGNECKGGVCPSTISSPGISPKVITVGAIDDRGTADPKDDKIWEKSSQGAFMEGKPDLVAEGTSVLSVLAAKSVYAERVGPEAHYLAISGSSQAAPMVAGAAALLLQVNPALTHDQIKHILSDTATPLPGARKAAQGAGRLNLEGAVQAATALPKPVTKKRKAS